MSSATSSLSLPARPGVTWRQAGLALALGLALLGWAFAPEAAAAIDTWDRSTAYNHCWLVLPLAAWLAWNRRQRLLGLTPTPAPIMALPALAAAIAWLAAERLGIMEGRQLAALALAECLVLAVLGWRIGRAMAGPLLYLVFLVPFGEFLVPMLQQVTAWMIVLGLKALAIPHYHDDLIIEIPAGTFLVAEACAGLRFIVAALAFGGLYALTVFRSPGRRLLVMALAIIVPIIANGIRALGIVLLGHYLGSAEAAAADHVLYGWVFFAVVILLLIIAGLPFREDSGPDDFRAARAPRRLPALPVLAAALALTAAAAISGPALATALARAAMAPPGTETPRLAIPPGCRATGPTSLRCGEATVTATLRLMPARATWSTVVAERRRLAGEDDEAMTFRVPAAAALWQVRQGRGAGEMVAVAAWLSGQPAGDGLRSRAAQAWISLGARGGRPVIAAVTWLADRQGDAAEQARNRDLFRTLLRAQDVGVGPQAGILSGQ